MMHVDLIYVDQYLNQLIEVIRSLPRERVTQIAAELREAQINGKRIFVFGNGGSAVAASHMACDFGKNTRQTGQRGIKIISLSDSTPTITAYANDEGYENIFSEPLRTLGEAGDIAIAISGSGNSPNVLKGVQAAKSMGLKTIGLTGFQGGKLKDLVDICLVVPSDSMEQIEDLHLIINHLLTSLLRKAE